MKRNIVVATTAVVYLCSTHLFSTASAQQTQQTQQAPMGQTSPSATPGQMTQPDTSGASGTAGTSGTSGAAGTSGTSGAAGTSGAPAAGTTGADTSGAPAAGTSGASGPIAGKSILGVTVVEMESVIVGWSARKELLGKAIQNDAKEKIGEIEDIIITPDKAASYAIVGVGGFLGMGERRVAIPFQQIKLQGNQLVLPGATKEALKTQPEFKYAPRK